MTQEELAQKLFVSSKAVSKRKTGQGPPDISLLDPLAKALNISVIELFAGHNVVNRNRSSNLLKAVCYICPICGNIILTIGNGVVSCCGITLPPLHAEDAEEEPDQDSAISVMPDAGESYDTVDHPMEKDHYITFMPACQTTAVRL